jgi:zinc D-Ala-D-Ala carboxypeptidase
LGSLRQWFYKLPEAYLRRIESIHLALQIPSNYGGLRKLTPYLEASDLVPVEGHERQHSLTPQAALQWHAMKSAAAKDEIELLLISGFRSVDRQREIIEDKLRKGIDLNTILTVNAAPGFSQHHTGLALDLGTPTHPNLMNGFENTAAFHWLTSNAAKFGFVMPYPRDNPYGLIYEPWHWMLVPIRDSNPLQIILPLAGDSNSPLL